MRRVATRIRRQTLVALVATLKASLRSRLEVRFSSMLAERVRIAQRVDLQELPRAVGMAAVKRPTPEVGAAAAAVLRIFELALTWRLELS